MGGTTSPGFPNSQPTGFCGTDAVWLSESHSHRGFSPVVKDALSQAFNRFNGLPCLYSSKSRLKTGETVCEREQLTLGHRAKAAV